MQDSDASVARVGQKFGLTCDVALGILVVD